MKTIRALALRVLLMTTLLTYGGTTMADSKPAPKSEPQQTTRVTLVGASIGEDWNFPHVGKRSSLTGYEFDYVGAYEFDKSALIAAILHRSSKPDFVLIKECSAYFPGNQSRYQQQIISWVEQLRAAGIQPVLVTTAPRGEPGGFIERTKGTFKRLLGRPTAMDGVIAFNDWLKQYGRQQNLPVFDLEAVLRNSSNRWMNPEYDSGDRLHVNKQAYDAMDRAFASFLPSLAAGGSKP